MFRNDTSVGTLSVNSLFHCRCLKLCWIFVHQRVQNHHIQMTWAAMTVLHLKSYNWFIGKWFISDIKSNVGSFSSIANTFFLNFWFYLPISCFFIWVSCLVRFLQSRHYHGFNLAHFPPLINERSLISFQSGISNLMNETFTVWPKEEHVTSLGIAFVCKCKWEIRDHSVISFSCVTE